MLSRSLALFLVLLLAACSKPPEVAATRPSDETGPATAPADGYTFGVFGDNRNEGSDHPAFEQIIKNLAADRPAMVLHTGDVIYGDIGDEANMHLLWRAFRHYVAPLKVPVHLSPGNHDIFNPVSARVWKQEVGETYSAFDEGGCRFIALDTQSAPSQVDDKQMEWLDAQLKTADDRLVFIYFHIPPFSSGPWLIPGLLGRDQNRLHKKFVEYKSKIGAVFCGHEHLFGNVTKDGIHYYITGGANATLYTPPGLGGFHHYLLVKVHGREFTVTVRPVSPAGMIQPGQPPRPLQAGDVLDDFEQPLRTWLAWDNSVALSRVAAPERPGQSALKMEFDTRFCKYPVLYSVFETPADFSKAAAIDIDVFINPQSANRLTLTCGIEGASTPGKTCDAPPVALNPGWNPIHLDLSAAWLTHDARRAARQINFMITARSTARAWVAFANLHAEGASAGSGALLEKWDRPIPWNMWSESATALTADHVTHGKSALDISLDPQSPAAVLYAALDPAWNLSAVHSVALDVFLPEPAVSGDLTLIFLKDHFTYPAAPLALKPGLNHLIIPLDPAWLPDSARANVQGIRLMLSTPKPKDPKGKIRQHIILDHLHAD